MKITNKKDIGQAVIIAGLSAVATGLAGWLVEIIKNKCKKKVVKPKKGK